MRRDAGASGRGIHRLLLEQKVQSMVIRGAFKRIAIALTLGVATLALPGVPRGFAADSAMTFQKLVEYFDLEVKEDRILKAVNESSTAFTLSDEQIKVLKSKGASDKLIEALKKKGASAGHVAAASSDITDFVLILDCSGSMRDRTSDGKTKWDVARQAALDLVNAIPNGRQLAFIAYGHNREQGCSWTNLWPDDSARVRTRPGADFAGCLLAFDRSKPNLLDL